jgi:SAM-dependent methyltransferase
MRPLGRWIYARQRRREIQAQSTATKFFRNLNQLAAFDGPLSAFTSAPQLRVLNVGCSVGCEAFSVAGHLALSNPRLDFQIDACDTSDEMLAVARSGAYSREHGLGAPTTWRERDLEARLFTRTGDRWLVVDDIRSRVRYHNADVLAPEFARYRGYDCVFGQNFMIHMNASEAERTFAALVAALRPGGALFAGGMDLDQRPALVASHGLVPLEWNLASIHDADDMRRSAWPWHYWSLEPIDTRAVPFLSRYSTIFLKPQVGAISHEAIVDSMIKSQRA